MRRYCEQLCGRDCLVDHSRKGNKTVACGDGNRDWRLPILSPSMCVYLNTAEPGKLGGSWLIQSKYRGEREGD